VIVVDTSAIMAILLMEVRAAEFAQIIERQSPVLVSAGTAIELAMVASRASEVFDDAMAFLGEPFIQIEPVDADQVALAVEGYRRFGKGRHRARLNFGDMFAYALARSRGLPLLFQGNDFAKTDVTPAAITAERHPKQELDEDRDEPPIIHQRSLS